MMRTILEPTQELSLQQQAASTRRVCPTNAFIEFQKKDIEQSVPSRFEQVVSGYSDRIAVKGKDHELTYSALNNAANAVARALLEQRGRHAESVALLLEQSALLIVAIIGVMKAGKFYVPLDSSYPVTRNTYMLEDSQAVLILTNNRNLSLVRELANPGHQVLNVDEIDFSLYCQNIGLSISPDTPSYILYTSGSTGQPKGVVQNHRNVLHNIMKYTNGLHICADDRLSLLSSCSFGAAASDIFGALLNGATLFPFNLKEEGLTNLANWLIQEEITIYHSVPTVFRHFVRILNGKEAFPKLRLIKLGGEPVNISDVELYRKHFSEDCIFHIGLGSTEMNIIRQYFIDKKTQFKGNVVPVGYAVADTEILLLDDTGEEVGFNSIGEIAIKSRYLSPAYWRRPDLTQAAFLPDPKRPDIRTYRTGDLGRLLPDGCLEHMGRKDFQVKIRGYRIEIAEVEKVLLDFGAFKEAIVVARKDQNGDQCLAAYITGGKASVAISELRSFLKEKLPEYMIPSALVQIEAMPLTPTGKIDRRALPAPDMVETKREDTFVTPRTLTEEMLARIWVDILSIESFQRNSTQINIHDNFFDIGGHSLFAARIIDQVRKVFQVELPLRRLFEFPTIAGLSKCIETERHAQPQAKCWSSLVPIQVSGSKKPFFLVPGGGGSEGEFMVYAKLVYLLGHEQPVYGLQAHGLDGEQVPKTQVETMATEYLKEIRAFQPNGPYLLGGECIGGLVAFEMAQQLQAQGQKVALLILLDTVYLNGVDYVTYLVYRQIRKIKRHWKTLSKFEPQERLPYFFDKAKKVMWRLIAKFHLNSVPSDHRIQHVKNNYQKTLRRYRPKPYSGRMVLLATEANYEKNSILGWETLAAGGLEIYKLPGDHTSYLGEQVQTTAKQLKACLDEAQAK
jgi:amino acid adenylation domain-containing protein